MLGELIIENVAVIEKASVGFAGGFTVLTGETGAGKSILLDSVNAILGSRASRDMVRANAARAVIWANFQDIPKALIRQLSEAGYPCDGELVLYREVTAEGKSVCRVNGAPATAAMLREVCGGLVDIHGQHDSQSLLNPAKHLSVLDAFAQNTELLRQYGDAYSEWAGIKRECAALDMDEAEKNRKMELLRFEADEIDAAQIVDGEEQELVRRRNVAAEAQNIQAALNAACYALNGGDDEAGAVTLLAGAAQQMETAGGAAAELTPFAESLRDLYYSAREVSFDMSSRLGSFDFDDSYVEKIEQRLDLLYRLKRRYGPTEAKIIDYGRRAREALEKIEFAQERLGELRQREERLAADVRELAARLTDSRKAAFEALEREIRDALAFLNMPGIAMSLRCAAVPCGPAGQDDMEFFITTNPGEAPKPLAKIASGGELARIMLAVKSALADRDDVPTVIYDEIDTGVSGLAAGRIGGLLRKTAAGRQVVCVTHTAQVAAHAHRHLLIEKKVEGGRAYTGVRELSKAERVEELARIISGDRITDAARANAAEMLESAQRQG